MDEKTRGFHKGLSQKYKESTAGATAIIRNTVSQAVECDSLVEVTTQVVQGRRREGQRPLPRNDYRRWRRATCRRVS